MTLQDGGARINVKCVITAAEHSGELSELTMRQQVCAASRSAAAQFVSHTTDVSAALKRPLLEVRGN